MEITLLFLVVAISLYVLFGGADFGGGLLEFSLRGEKTLQKKLRETLAPVWETNHVWLIAVLVILFVGFPVFYSDLLTRLFIPISLALVGIILRGAFFTFSKYDPEPGQWSSFYNWLFRTSSALTPLMFGFIVAALLVPQEKELPMNFSDAYIFNWFSFFGFLCGLFVNALFAYLASVFLFGEVEKKEYKNILKKRIFLFFISTFLIGGSVLLYGLGEIRLTERDIFNPIQISGQIVALLCIPWLFHSLKNENKWMLRLAAGAQVVAILSGWFSTQYPNFITYTDGTFLTFSDAVAPSITILWLNIGLTVVVAIVAPLIIYLYRIFGKSQKEIA